MFYGRAMTPDCEITGRTDGAPASMADYQALFAASNRPHKFAAVEVGFESGTLRSAALVLKGLDCGRCHHYFVNGPGDRRVCEIMRLPSEAAVPEFGTCRFWNQDGKFPLLRVI